MGVREVASALLGAEPREQRMSLTQWMDRWSVWSTAGFGGGSVGYDQAQAHSAVYACTDLIARLIAWQMPVEVDGQPVGTFGRTGVLSITANPHPEPHMGRQHWEAQVIESAILRGYACGLVTSFSDRGYPLQILPLHPDVLSWEDVDGRWRWRVDGKQAELWQVGGDLWVAPAMKVTPGRPVGRGVLYHAAEQVRLGLSAGKFGRDFFDAGGLPVAHGRVLDNPNVTQEQAQSIKNRILQTTRNREPLVTGSNFELTTIPINAEESQFLATMQANVADVCRFFGVPPESIGASSGDSMCVDTETEMLTTRGWLRYDEIEVGDSCLTLNVETGLAEWQPVEAVYVFDGPHEVMRFEHGSHSSVSTTNHRWPVLERGADDLTWRESRTLTCDDRVLAAAPVANLPTEPKWSDAFVELVAWFYTEGYIAPTGGVTIAQSERVNPELCNRIRAALGATYGPAAGGQVRSRPAWVEDRRECIKFRLNKLAAAPLLDVAPDKVPTVEWLSSLTRSQLELFIATSIAADGWVTRNGTPILGQKDRRRVDAFQVACVLAGRSGVVRQDGSGRWWMAVQRGNLRKPKGHMQYLERMVIDGPVWCPTTPNRTWFARRNGTTYFTGNTYANVEGRNLSLLTNTVGAWMQWLEWAMSSLLPSAQSVRLDPEALLRTSVPTLYDTAQKAVGRGNTPGVLTVNEARAMLGYGPLPDGDKLFVPVNYMPADMAGDQLNQGGGQNA